jgi:hypothetical protein
MRFILECRIPVETGNCSVMDGSMPGKFKKYLESEKNGSSVLYDTGWAADDDCCCEHPKRGQDGGNDGTPWLDSEGYVTCEPAMSLADMQKGSQGHGKGRKRAELMSGEIIIF